ncbi:family 43 glycosylhydrolase [Candidatus Epulonipiscium viviparus]|uniref:family 43 glycosylhydrolase n=1 Tax=Candidatus Epulonipiscium viviparus TaxID=420336 RepID=UPI00016BFEFA|nr:family 43 glycosylhydrolase [Candidatus Epulopiscium viviparus]
MIINANIFPGEGYADPHAVIHDGRVYLFCGRDLSTRIEDFCRMHKWSIISSNDLIHWRYEADILPKDTYIGEKNHCFAGHIVKKDDTFYWYFSNLTYSIGVMTSKSPTGPFVDALGKPLIPDKFAATKSYDPCVYEEDGKYTLFFGAGKYFCVDLAEDMISVDGPPSAIDVLDANGKNVGMGDKSTVFKHNDKYYLASGNKYAMADTLKGPYTFIGTFPGGHHNDFFIFNGKPYLSYEMHDVNIYFRGIAITSLEFAEDGKLVLHPDNLSDVFTYRYWDFSSSTDFWFLTNGADATHVDDGIAYELNSYVGLRSPVFPRLVMDKDYVLKITLENYNADVKLKVLIDTVRSMRGFAKDPNIFTHSTTIELAKGTQTYDIIETHEADAHLRCIRIFGAGPEDMGEISIKNIELKAK